MLINFKQVGERERVGKREGKEERNRGNNNKKDIRTQKTNKQTQSTQLPTQLLHGVKYRVKVELGLSWERTQYIKEYMDESKNRVQTNGKQM